jgi:hypothetical protein
MVSSDVTIRNLSKNQSIIVNEINSLPGGNIQNTSITHGKLDANSDPVNRWDEAFNDFVYTGLLPPTATGLSSTTTLGTAYIEGMRVVKDATAHTYTASKDTYVDLSKDGVYTYSEVANGAAAPAVAANSIRLAKVVTDGSDVTSVTDLRTLQISLAVEDFYIKGMELIVVSPDAENVTVDAGVCYAGSSRVEKTVQTCLTITDANDWWDGATDTLSGQWNYVGVNGDGDIKYLGEAGPDYADTSGNQNGALRYWYDSAGTEYWRVIGAVSMDNNNNICLWFVQYGNRVDYINVSSNKKLRVLKDGAATSWASIDCRMAVPAFSNRINIAYDVGANSDVFWIRPDHYRVSGGRKGACSYAKMTFHMPNLLLGNVSTDAGQYAEYYMSGGAGNPLDIYVTGFSLEPLR